MYCIFVFDKLWVNKCNSRYFQTARFHTIETNALYWLANNKVKQLCFPKCELLSAQLIRRLLLRCLFELLNKPWAKTLPWMSRYLNFPLSKSFYLREVKGTNPGIVKCICPLKSLLRPIKAFFWKKSHFDSKYLNGILKSHAFMWQMNHKFEKQTKNRIT